MRTVCSPRHRLRDARTELYGGQLVPPFDTPRRIDFILERIAAVNLGDVVEPDPHGLEPVRRIHDPDYLAFLASCWDDWQAAGFSGEAIPTVWPSRRMTRATPPRHIDGRIGYYALAAETSIGPGTWEAAQASADVALSALALLTGGERATFALCRPPGHHAARDMFGGYCFLNNAAIAAQALLDRGAARVAVLDIDFHHGNGTQSIFYERADVLFLSLHGAPDDAFPYFLGGADETGSGDGAGFNFNYPLPPGCGFDRWSVALDEACERIERNAPDGLVVSLGVDTFEADPISFFRLTSDDYLTVGERLARLGLATLFVMEGGYAVEEIGLNTVNILQGFEGAMQQKGAPRPPSCR